MAAPDLLGDNAPDYSAHLFPTPRTFQYGAHEALRQGAREQHRIQMLCSPTGSGKTYLGLRACSEALVKGRSAMFLCDRITLIDQTSETADAYGLRAHGIIQANHWRSDPDLPFQIASSQTIASRGWPYRDPDLLVIDEAHTQMAAWVDKLPTFKGHVIGLSATPFSRGLGKLFTNLVNAATMAELVDIGVLVPLRVLSAIKPDMAGAKTTSGEWQAGEAAERGLSIVGDIVTTWQEHAEGRKTICFGATIAHCEAIARQFNEAGIMAAVFCADTTPKDRAAILAEYRKLDSVIKVLVSVEALAKGFDVPSVRCIIDARPLRKGLSTFIQMVGRGVRSDVENGKTDCLLIDHSGNILRFAADFEDFYFNGLRKLDDAEHYDSDIRKDPEQREIRSCPKCGVSPFVKQCIGCGFKLVRSNNIEHEESAGMREIFVGKKRLADNREDLYDQFVSYCLGSGNPATAKGRAAHLYRDVLGVWPPYYFNFDMAAQKNVPVSEAVRGKARAHHIRFVRGKGFGARK